jgi:hypothetical protein
MTTLKQYFMNILYEKFDIEEEQEQSKNANLFIAWVKEWLTEKRQAVIDADTEEPHNTLEENQFKQILVEEYDELLEELKQ